METVERKYEDGFKPVQPARYPVPYHYQVIFQSHLGLHKRKRLIFGLTNSYDVCHSEDTKVYGRDGDEHNRNREAMREREREKGVTLKTNTNRDSVGLKHFPTLTRRSLSLGRSSSLTG